MVIILLLADLVLRISLITQMNEEGALKFHSMMGFFFLLSLFLISASHIHSWPNLSIKIIISGRLLEHFPVKHEFGSEISLCESKFNHILGKEKVICSIMIVHLQVNLNMEVILSLLMCENLVQNPFYWAKKVLFVVVIEHILSGFAGG